MLDVESDVSVPLLLLLPAQNKRAAAVVAVCQEGKERFLRERHAAVAELLSSGIAVCLADLRGTGETAPAGAARDRTSAATSLSASEWMLGGTLLAARLRDLRTVIGHLRTHDRIAPQRLAIWVDSFAPVNPPDQPIVAPHGISKRPAVAEPAGGVLAVLAALFEDDVQAVYARRTLISYRTALNSPAIHLPHDAIIPGVTAAGDLPAVLAAIPQVAVRFDEPIDGANRSLDQQTIAALEASTSRPIRSRPLTIRPRADDSHSEAKWIVDQLAAPATP
jgi:hypothetical protein